MKNALVLFAFLSITGTLSSQEKFPELTNDALVSSVNSNVSHQEPYKLVVFGAIGCSYSRFLIDQLSYFEDCEQLEIIILLEDSKEAILKEYPELIKTYRVYTNDILNYKLAKKQDITPQTFLFKDGKQLLNIKGVKKRMFIKINKKINCNS
jgi:thiol-disulfide isomerase/thioredoxin